MTPYFILGAISLLCFAVVAVMEIWEAGEKQKRQAVLEHLDKLRREAEMEKKYRKTIRKDEPALVRLRELGFMQACGHHPYHWNGFKGECEQCVREGRVVAKDGGRQG